MTTNNRLIDDFKKKTNRNIWKFLDRMAGNYNVYSEHVSGINPHLENNDIYFYAYTTAFGTSLVVVCIDNSIPKDEIADEEMLPNENPRWYSENSHRTSPVWSLFETMKQIEQKVAVYGEDWTYWGVLLSGSNIKNANDMHDVWEGMCITVIDNLPNLSKKKIKVNNDQEIYPGDLLIGALQDLFKQPAPVVTTNRSYYTEEEFEAEQKEEEKKEISFFDWLNALDSDNDDSNGEAEEEKSEEAPELDLPSGIIEQNNITSVTVKILPPLDNPRAELDKLVGCNDIKERIDELLALTHYNKLLREAFPDAKQHEVSLHSIFIGHPGTGKTTVCKIFGSLLHEAGALSKGHVVVADRGTFIGSLWGDEERSLRQVLEIAQGGVLMIDEAYLLNSSQSNDPGKLVLQLLMNLLADESQRDIAVVLCGYEEPMKRLLDLNPGLPSRFPNQFVFSDFSVDELLEITRRRVDEYNYHFTQPAWQKFKDILTSAYQACDQQTWGNARFVTNQLERIYIQHAQRCVKEPPQEKWQIRELLPEDIKPIEVVRSKPRIGF